MVEVIDTNGKKKQSSTGYYVVDTSSGAGFSTRNPIHYGSGYESYTDQAKSIEASRRYGSSGRKPSTTEQQKPPSPTTAQTIREGAGRTTSTGEQVYRGGKWVTTRPVSQTTTTRTPYTIGRSGGVWVGGRGYYNQSIVPGFGKTARELQLGVAEKGYSGVSGQIVEIKTGTGLEHKPMPFSYSLDLPSERKQRQRFGTRTDLIQQPTYDIHLQPYIKRGVTEQFSSLETGYKEVPIVAYTYVDPTVTGKQSERPATKEEVSYVESFGKIKVKEKEKGISPFTSHAIGRAEFVYKQWSEVPRRNLAVLPIRKWRTEFHQEQEKILTSLEKIPYFPKGATQVTRLQTGFVWGSAVDIQEQPLKNVALFGAGALVGGGVKLVSKGASYIPIMGQSIASTFKFGTIIGGTALTSAYAYQTGVQVVSAKDDFRRGEIIGVATKDIASLGLGFKSGEKGVEKIFGRFATRKGTEIPIERLTPQEVITGKKSFPTAKQYKHYSLFQETKYKYPELSDFQKVTKLKGYTGKGVTLSISEAKKLPFKVDSGKAGGFHTTGEKFWGKEISPIPGQSELGGLYISPDVSIHFARISGSGSSSKLFPTLKQIMMSIFAGERPAIAYLKPSGFRVASWKGTKKTGYKWTTSPKKGYADIPLQKTEIEAVLRPESGSYVFESGKYYTTIKGVRVPIDVFRYGGKPTTTIKTPKTFTPSSYSYLPKTSSLVSPRITSLGYFASSSKAMSSSMSSMVSKISSSKISSPSKIASSFVSSKLSYKPYSPTSYRSYRQSYKSSYVPYRAPPSSYIAPTKIIRPFAPPIPIPKLDIKIKIPKTKMLPFLAPQPFKYQPSLKALVFKIKAPSKPKFSFTGLGIRPIVKTKSRRRTKSRYMSWW